MRIKPIGNTINSMARMIIMRDPTEIFINGKCAWKSHYQQFLINYFDMKDYYTDTIHRIEDNITELIWILESDDEIIDYDEVDKLGHRIIYIKTKEGGDNDV